MNITKEDRRSRRSRRMLKQAVAALMQEKDFKDITIKDITDRADLNRGTFYLHYSDTYDLLEKVENEILEDFQRMIDQFFPSPNSETLLSVIEPIVDYIVENVDICKILFENKASVDFIIKFRDLICRNGRSIIQKSFGKTDTEKYDYFFGFITYGIIGMLKQWFESDMALPKQEITRMIDKTVSASARALLVG